MTGTVRRAVASRESASRGRSPEATARPYRGDSGPAGSGRCEAGDRHRPLGAIRQQLAAASTTSSPSACCSRIEPVTAERRRRDRQRLPIGTSARASTSRRTRTSSDLPLRTPVARRADEPLLFKGERLAASTDDPVARRPSRLGRRRLTRAARPSTRSAVGRPRLGGSGYPPGLTEARSQETRCPPSMSTRSAPSSRPSPASRTAGRSPSSTGRAARRSRSASSTPSSATTATRTPTPAARSRRARLTRRDRRPRRTRAVADFLGAASPDEIKFGYNMTTLTLHIGRSIGATLEPGDEIVVTTLDHEANVSHLAGDGRRSRRDGPDGRHPTRTTSRSTSRTSSRSSAPRTKLVAVGYASNAVGTINPVARDRRARPRGRRPDLRRRGRVRAARPDRRPGARHRLPRLLGVQVVRAAPRRAVRQGRGPRPPAGLQGPAGPRPVRDRDAVVRIDRRARSRPPTTCATSGGATAT